MHWLMTLTLACAALLSGGRTHAQELALNFPTNVAALPGGGYATNGAMSFTSKAANAAYTTNIGGRAVTVPATWRLAANAGQFAANAVRFNPTVLVGTAVAAWLLPYGIEWAVDKWQKKTQDPNQCTADCYLWRARTPAGNYSPFFNTREEAADWVVTWSNQNYPGFVPVTRSGITYTPGQTFYSFTLYRNGGTNWTSVNGERGAARAPDPDTYSVPTDTDWQAVNDITDNAASELAGKKAQLPLTPQQPAPVDFPLSDPYTDPLTGKRYQDKGRIEPGTTPGKGKLTTFKQELDPATNQPVTDANGNPVNANPDQKDECAMFPNRIGCLEKDEIPQAPDLQTDERTISITPQGGFGADTASCPADLTTSYLGQPIAWSFAPVCTAADALRPLVIGMAWISAVLIAMGIARKGV